MSRPKPLFLSTAQQLGIHRTRGVPSLLDSLLSTGECLARMLLTDCPPCSVYVRAYAANEAHAQQGAAGCLPVN